MPAVVLYASCLGLAFLLCGVGSVRSALARARWLGPLLAVTAVILAGIVGLEGWRIHGGSALRLGACVGVGLLGTGVLGRWIRLQRWVNLEVQDAAGRLQEPNRMAIWPAVRAVAVLLVLNPAGWLAATLAGLTGDWRWMAWKAVLDALTLVGLPVGPRAAVFGGALVSIGFHGLLENGAGWLRPVLEGRDAVGVWVMASAWVWLTLPLLVLRLRVVPMAKLAMAVPLAVAVACLWSAAA